MPCLPTSMAGGVSEFAGVHVVVSTALMTRVEFLPWSGVL